MLCRRALIWPTMPGAENTSFKECLYAVVAGATTSLALFKIIGLHERVSVLISRCSVSESRNSRRQPLADDLEHHRMF